MYEQRMKNKRKSQMERIYKEEHKTQGKHQTKKQEKQRLN